MWLNTVKIIPVQYFCLPVWAGFTRFMWSLTLIRALLFIVMKVINESIKCILLQTNVLFCFRYMSNNLPVLHLFCCCFLLYDQLSFGLLYLLKCCYLDSPFLPLETYPVISESQIISFFIQ